MAKAGWSDRGEDGMPDRARLSAAQIEEGAELALDFAKLERVAGAGQHVLPVVVQDAASGEVLILAYANRAALEHTLRTGFATFWSTSRAELWVKGATSGDYLDVEEVRVNCEQNSLLYRVWHRGAGACHTRDATGATRRGCYYRRITDTGDLEPVAPV